MAAGKSSERGFALIGRSGNRVGRTESFSIFIPGRTKVKKIYIRITQIRTNGLIPPHIRTFVLICQGLMLD
jgi:predicted RNA-binding protein with TRAM domain